MSVAPIRSGRGPGTAGSGHLERSSIYVLLNTAATGALGTVFWLVAARFSDESDVAAAVAAASILISAAFLCQLNLPTGLSRFLPAAGADQESLVRRAYLVTLGASGVAALGVLGAGALRGGPVVDGGSTLLTVVLAVSVPVWVIFALQDGVLVTLRESKWVPVENVVTTLAKYALLPVCVGVGGGAGILIAWTAPALAGIVVVTWFLFRRVLPRLQQTLTGPATTGVAVGPLLAYSLRDFPGAALQLLSLRLVPVLVLELGNDGDGAYIGLPWTILTVAVLVLPMLSRALLSELSHDGAETDELMRRATRLVLWGLLPATALGALLVGPLLSVAGSEYADRGTVILAFGALGVAPAAYVECRLALLRFHHRVAHSGVFQSIQAVALLAAVVALLLTDHVRYLGVAFLAVNVVAALVVDPLTRFVLRNDSTVHPVA
ncbi:lipopolysaccharide biosynthesis protein [Actinospongicola halichondriae]|uniref:lipopolysaccharide biosynthesis protein n=1 Tax=Actinospongicola halichondriae TaxID=3236844 RepID=UPI003D476F3D